MITRVDRQRAVSLSGNLDGLVLADAVERARRYAAEMLPEGVMLRVAGDAAEMEEAGRQFFMMLVLAAQFESFVQPLSVMLALPFSMVGALGGLFVAGMTLNLFSMIGIILLIGLVTKNSILLVDYANQLRREGADKVEAMRTAAPVRMRPVLMTALSMVFGVLPAAIGVGPGAESRQPMAIVGKHRHAADIGLDRGLFEQGLQYIEIARGDPVFSRRRELTGNRHSAGAQGLIKIVDLSRDELE